MPEYVTKEEMFKLKKEFQEFKARQEEKDKLIDSFWKERIAYISIIVALLVALITLYLR